MSTNMAQPECGYFDNRTANAARQPQVPTAFQELERAIEEGHKTCAELEARLQPLLRSEPQEATGNVGDSRPTMVQLAMNIDGYTRQLRLITATYQSILRRLEL